MGANMSKSTFCIFIIVSLLIPAGGLYCQDYWDAAFRLGYEPKTKRVDNALACQRIESIHRLRDLIFSKLTADRDLLGQLSDLDSRITSLDVANVYDFLPYSDSESQWRAIGIRGQSGANAYRLNVVDPNIDKWRNSPTQDRADLAGSQAYLGDIDLGIFISPHRKNTFRFFTQARLYLDDIPAANFMRVFEGILTATWAYADGTGNPTRNVIAKKGDDGQSIKILNGIAGNFPELFRIICQYTDIERVVSSDTKSFGDSLLFDIKARLNYDAFSRHYPELGELLKKWREIVKFKAHVFDKQNNLMAVVGLDSAKNLFTMQFRILKDRFLPMRHDHGGFNLIGVDSAQLKVLCDVLLNIVGMRLKIDALPVAFEYWFNDGAPYLISRIVERPHQIEAGGSVYGIIPVWMVDMLIPSNVKDIMNGFFEILASGNAGNGSVIKIRGSPESDMKQTVMIDTDAEVLANGTIKMGFNLQRKFFKMSPKLISEIRAFRTQFWHAFYRDFQRIKTQCKFQLATDPHR